MMPFIKALRKSAKLFRPIMSLSRRRGKGIWDDAFYRSFEEARQALSPDNVPQSARNAGKISRMTPFIEVLRKSAKLFRPIMSLVGAKCGRGI
jgi:hypothetical protein